MGLGSLSAALHHRPRLLPLSPSPTPPSPPVPPCRSAAVVPLQPGGGLMDGSLQPCPLLSTRTTTSPCRCRMARHAAASRLSSRWRPSGALRMPVSAVLPRLSLQPRLRLPVRSVAKRSGSPKPRRLLLAAPPLPALPRARLLLRRLRPPPPLQLALTPRAFVVFSPLSPRTVLQPPNSYAPCHPLQRRPHSPPSPVLRPLLPLLTKLIFWRTMSLLLPALRFVTLLQRLGAAPLSVGVAQLARVRPLVSLAAILLLLCALLPRPASLLLLPHAREPRSPLVGAPRAVLLPLVARPLLVRVVLCRSTSLIRTLRAGRCSAFPPPPPPRLTAQAAPSAAPVHLLPLLGVVLSAGNVLHPLNVVTVLSAAVAPSPAPSAACVPLQALLTCYLPPSSPPLVGLKTTKALLMTASPPPR